MVGFGLFGQRPSADFNIPSDACLNEQFLAQNSSSDALHFVWDFCSGDYYQGALAQPFLTGGGLFTPTGISMVRHNEEWYGFIVNVGNNSISLASFGKDLHAAPILQNLGNLGGMLSQPQDIKAISDNGNLYLFVFNRSVNQVIRINMGASVDNASPSTDILLAGNSEIINSGLDVFRDDNGWHLFFTGSNKFTRLYLGSNIENIPTGTDLYPSMAVPGANGVGDISIVRLEDGNFVGLIVCFNSKSLHRITFGNMLSNAPSFSNITPAIFTSIATPYGLAIKNYGSKQLAFISTNNGELVRLNFSDGLSNPFTSENLGSLGVLNRTLKIDLATFESKSVLVSQAWQFNRFYQVNFDNQCFATPSISTDFQPTISYSATGTYPITLTGLDAAGNSSSTTKEITVTNNTAPAIDFETGTALCITDPISFNGISNESISITSWSWNFGDGNSATGQNPDHTYATAGEYEVLLTIEGTNGCNNRFQKIVTVYEPQPVTFNNSAQGAICSQKPILFENTSIVPDIATYNWNFGDGNTSTLENPEHIFASSGEYTVGLTVSFAGCQSYAEQTVTVNPGPAVSFTTVDNCLGQTVSFENTSIGDFITGYLWDFGDGTTSTQEDPEYSFETAGTQMIELTAFTSNGCNFTIQQEIEVYPVAVVDFSTEIACATQPVQFNEEVFLELSNVTDYLWDFGIAGSNTDISNEANPQFSFPDAGTYQVSLQVTTADGCVSQGQKSITVQSSPETSFSYVPKCVGSTITFLGNANQSISTNYWELQSNLGEVLAVGSQANFSYNFTNAGIYRLRYRQQNTQLCSNEYEEMIEILSNPVPDFTFTQSCAGLPISFTNSTELFGNTVESFSWNMGGEATLNNENPEFTFAEPGNYTVSLEVNTLSGCTETFTQTIEVKPRPDVTFDLEQTVGAYPFKLNAIVQQQLDFTYEWTINGQLVSEEVSLMETLQEAGNYLIRLSATNSEGCTNSFSQQVRVRVPEMDISLGNLRVVTQGDLTGFVISITNRGSLIPEFIDLNVDLGDFSITERVDRVISPESTVNYAMRLNLTESQLRGLNKICLDAKVVSSALLEENIGNNRICTNLDDAFRVMDIYPNPARANVTVPVIVPSDGDLMVVIEQSDGKQSINLRFELQAGYNEIKIDGANLKSGIYFIRFRYEGLEKVKKVVFQ